jgi:hypothetical protein
MVAKNDNTLSLKIDYYSKTNLKITSLTFIFEKVKVQGHLLRALLRAFCV